MEGILARKNQDEGTTPATEPEGEVSVSPSVEQPRVTVAKPPNQQVQARVNAGATRGRNSVVNPMFHTPPPPPWSHRGLGQGWCQRGERSVEPETRNERQVSFERPIRCANTHFGGFCGTYNFVEAPFCSGCGIAYPNGLPRGTTLQALPGRSG